MIFLWRSLLLKTITSSWRTRNWFPVTQGPTTSSVPSRTTIWPTRTSLAPSSREWGPGVRGMDAGVPWPYNPRFPGSRPFVFLILYFFWPWTLSYTLCFFGFHIVLLWNLDLDFHSFLINLDKWPFILEIKRFFSLCRIELCFNLFGIVY